MKEIEARALERSRQKLKQLLWTMVAQDNCGVSSFIRNGQCSQIKRGAQTSSTGVEESWLIHFKYYNSFIKNALVNGFTFPKVVYLCVFDGCFMQYVV